MFSIEFLYCGLFNFFFCCSLLHILSSCCCVRCSVSQRCNQICIQWLGMRVISVLFCENFHQFQFISQVVISSVLILIIDELFGLQPLFEIRLIHPERKSGHCLKHIENNSLFNIHHTKGHCIIYSTRIHIVTQNIDTLSHSQSCTFLMTSQIKSIAHSKASARVVLYGCNLGLWRATTIYFCVHIIYLCDFSLKSMTFSIQWIFPNRRACKALLKYDLLVFK